MFKFNFKENSFDKEKIIQLFETSLEKYKTKEEIKTILASIFDNERFYIYCNQNPYQNHDFEFSYDLIDQAKQFLNNQEAMFFTSEIDSLLKTEPFAVAVDSDYDTYLIKPNLKEITSGLTISNMLPDAFTVEDLLIKNKIYINDFKEKWNLLGTYENLVKVETSIYQVGGYQNYFVQGEYSNFIGHFDGDYGDAGVLTLYIVDKEIQAQVDMC